MGQLVGGIMQFAPVRRLLSEPLLIMTAAAVAMICGHVDMLVAVVRQLEFVGRFAAKLIGLFLFVIAAVTLPSFGNGTGFREILV